MCLCFLTDFYRVISVCDFFPLNLCAFELKVLPTHSLAILLQLRKKKEEKSP
jgi:hypothetical protein